MNKCPRCQARIEKYREVCPKCHMGLVKDLPPAPEMHPGFVKTQAEIQDAFQKLEEGLVDILMARQAAHDAFIKAVSKAMIEAAISRLFRKEGGNA